MKIPAWLEGLFLTACLTLTLPLQATIIPVTNLADHGPGSLREAVGSAGSGDTIEVKIEGRILLDTQILITDTFTIRGLSPSESYISGQEKTRMFEIPDTGNLHLANFTFEKGNADSYFPIKAGGVARVFGTISVENCVFRDNVAAAGGAFFLEGSAGFSPRGRFVNCSFYNNQAVLIPDILVARSGGALFGDGLDGGDSFIEAYNCTFSGNYALLDGGAIFIVSRGEGISRFLGRHCTITDNEAGRFGGGIDNSSANSVDIANSIISGNRSDLGTEDLYGTVNSMGHNLIGNGPLNFTPALTDIITPNPQLGPLGNHGSVLFTHAPQCESPAIDQADPSFAPAEDLRGQPRLNLPDIGSHELVPEVDIVVKNLNDQGPNSLREVILLSCPGDTIDLIEVEGVIQIEKPIMIEKEVSLKGNSQAGVVIDGNRTTRLVEILPSGKLYGSDLTFRHGLADSYGGGGFFNQGTLYLERCAVVLCEAEAGGGIANYGNFITARTDLINCTLSNNKARDYAGGAIDNRGYTYGARVNLTNCTVAENEAAFQGGGISNSPDSISTVSMINTLFAQNLGEQGPNLHGTFITLGHNLIDNGNGFTTNSEVSDIIGAGASIDQLGTWDGVTPTHRLRENSPAIDAGDNSVATNLDQRRRVRIFNEQVDIGAYEYDPATKIQSELTSRHSVSVHPNPMVRDFTVKLSRSDLHLKRIDLIDFQGKLIFTWESEWASDQMIDLALPTILPEAFYMLKISTEQHIFWEKISVSSKP